MGAPVAIAPPTRFRLYLSLYFLLVTLFLVAVIATGLAHGALLALIAAGPLIGVVSLFVRGWQLSAFADERGLTVRNWFATRRFNRGVIRAFRLGGSATGWGRNAIQVLTTEGTSLPISASIRPWYSITADQQAQWLETLEAWRRAGLSDRSRSITPD